MNKLKLALLTVCAIAAFSPAIAFSEITKLTFEGLQDYEEILDFYNGGTGSLGSSGPDFGISFGAGALALIDSDEGGSGNFANEPSPDTVAFWLAGDSLVMNVAAGFDTGFSFYYTSSTEATVTVYDGLDGTGNVLGEITVVAQHTGNGCTGDPTGTFCNWSPAGVDFEGTALSVDFSGTANQTAYDNITFGTSDPSTPSTKATFKVTKTFSDGSTDEVDVLLTCNSGLPLEQTFTIAGGDTKGVTFVLTGIPEAGADCEVTETGSPAGYEVLYNGSADGCSWTGVTGGDSLTCVISNVANPAMYTVLKEWMVPPGGGDEVVLEAVVKVECDSFFDGGQEDDGIWSMDITLTGNQGVTIAVDVTDGPATCSASETINQSGVEWSSDGCGEVPLSAGDSHTCTFTNTVFFEGIPTLSQYGLAVLALLMLGVGFVGLRRFV